MVISQKGPYQKGTGEFISTQNCLTVHWKVKSDVFVVPTIHGNQIKQLQCHGEEERVSKLRMITQYNNYMNGEDK